MWGGATWRISGALLLAMLAVAPIGATAQTEEDYQRIRRGTVFIQISGRLQDGQQVSSTASGYFVDTAGHILTAQHILFHRTEQGLFERYYDVPQLCVIVGDSDPTQRCHPVDIIHPADLGAIDLGQDFPIDVAMLRLRATQEPISYTPLSMCAQYAAREGSQEAFTAYGFPRGDRFRDRDGRFDGQNGRVWQTRIPTTHGMSGGPVVNSHGDVVGLVSGGETSGLYSTVAPLLYAGPLLHGYRANLNACSARAVQPIPSPREVSGSCEAAELDSLFQASSGMTNFSERDAEQTYVMYRALACNDYGRAVSFTNAITNFQLKDACAARVVEDLVVKGRAAEARSTMSRLQTTDFTARDTITRMATRGAFDSAAQALLARCAVPEQPS